MDRKLKQLNVISKQLYATLVTLRPILILGFFMRRHKNGEEPTNITKELGKWRMKTNQ